MLPRYVKVQVPSWLGVRCTSPLIKYQVESVRKNHPESDEGEDEDENENELARYLDSLVAIYCCCGHNADISCLEITSFVSVFKSEPTPRKDDSCSA